MEKIRISRLKRFHGLLTIALGATITLFAAWLFTFFLFLIKGKPIPSIYGLPVDILMRNNRVLIDSSKQIYVGDIKGSILLFNPSNLIAIYSCLYTVFIWLCLSYIIYLMRKIIGTIIAGNPFVLQNRTRLRIIGGIFAAGPALLHFISQCFVSHLIPLIKIE
ncbi:MAG: hypothetical protein P4L45_01670, partial [Ignavibacteriaceae bacterium]|nr:hypothetical protein [Ignavibacteriaceae bacterium]